MQTQEVAELLGIATSTIRIWTRDEFRRYFSESAKGTPGASDLPDGQHKKRRHFTETDARILTLIVQMKAENKGAEQIHASLRHLEANDWVGLPELPPAPPSSGPISMIPREAAETKIDEQRRALMREISDLSSQVENLEKELGGLRSENKDLSFKLGKAEGKLEQLDGLLQEREELLSQLSRLQEHYGKASGALEERQGTRFWLSVVAGITTIAIILLIVILLLGR